MKVRVNPSKPFGTVAAPPSKSYAHRLMICAALSHGVSIVRGISDSQDMKATMDCISSLGVEYTQDNNILTIQGGIRDIDDGTVFNCRESGSTLRFMIPIAMTTGKKVNFVGSQRLIERGISVYEDLFRQRNITITKTIDTITIDGRLQPGDYIIRGDISSQFVSGLLFSLPLLEGDSTIQLLPPVESKKYIDITIDAMSRFGVSVIRQDDNTFYIHGNQTYHSTQTEVEGDWSNAAALFAFNSIGGNIDITGLNPDSLQGDRVCIDLLKKLDEPSPVIDITDCPDLGPVLFSIAAIKHGAKFVGTRRLRIKESDRAKAMADELKKFGICTDITDNTVVIHNNDLAVPNTDLCSHNDHRIVMAMTLLASITGSVIDDAQSISKSYPDFFHILKALHLEVQDEIG